MSEDRFGFWLRASSRSGSRRQVAAGLLAVVAGAAVGVAPNLDAAAASRKKRRGDVCRKKRDGATCENDGQCLNGKCKRQPVCDSAGSVCGEGQFDCCSGKCVIALGHSTGACARGDAGARCRTADDCQSGLCAGFVCQG